MNFVKYQGLGNDFVIVEHRENVDYAGIASKVCDRHFGIGADGLVTLRPVASRRWEMRIYNADGSETEMCGNATRCVAKYLNRSGVIELDTRAGIIRPELLDSGLVRVDMGEPVVGEERKLNGFSGRCVSMGNPHFVIFVADVSRIELEKAGPQLEHHDYFPNRSNIEFAQIIGQDHIRMRVWERGCGITMACGTGSCATAVAAVEAKLTGREVTLHLDGGELLIAWNTPDRHIHMTGEAQKVFEGVYHV